MGDERHSNEAKEIIHVRQGGQKENDLLSKAALQGVARERQQMGLER